MANKITISSSNCHSVKSLVNEIVKLCNLSDFFCIQEYWLLPFELNFLNSLHLEYIAASNSAVDLTEGILTGRPFGGTGILYEKSLMSSLSVVETFDSFITALQLSTNLGPLLLASVYMPVDYGDAVCLENYTDERSRLSATYLDSDVVHAVIICDFNCYPGSRFFECFLS